MSLIGPSKGGGGGHGQTGGWADDQVWEAVGASFWIQMIILRTFWKCL